MNGGIIKELNLGFSSNNNFDIQHTHTQTDTLWNEKASIFPDRMYKIFIYREIFTSAPLNLATISILLESRLYATWKSSFKTIHAWSSHRLCSFSSPSSSSPPTFTNGKIIISIIWIRTVSKRFWHTEIRCLFYLKAIFHHFLVPTKLFWDEKDSITSASETKCTWMQKVKKEKKWQEIEDSSY